MIHPKILKLSLFICLNAIWIPTPSSILQASQNSQASTSRDQIPTEVFARLPFIEHPSLSPNGEFLAGLMAHQGEQRIVIVTLDPAKRKGVVRLAVPANSEVQSIRWANDQWALISLTAQMKIHAESFYISRLVAVNRNDGQPTPILPDLKGQDTANIVWIPSNGKDEIFVAGQASIYTNRDGFWPAVYRVNLKNGRGRLEQVGREGVWDWGVDQNGVVRLGFGYNDFTGNQSLLYRRFDGTGLKTVERADQVEFERLRVPLLFLAGTDRALVLAENEDERSIVVERDMLSQTDLKTRYDYQEFSILKPVLSFDRSQILGFRTNDFNNPMRWLDEDLKKAQNTLDQATPNSTAEIISFSKDRTKLLVLVKTADSPGLIYFFDNATGTLNRLAALNQALKNRRLAEAKFIRYKARDGLEIEAVLTLPQDRKAENLPLVVMPHGGPWAHDTLDYDYWAQFIASRGYAVVQPNFRGSTGYGDSFRRRGEGELGFAMQDDLTDSLNHLSAEGIVDPKKVCIVGGSYGGYAAMWGIAKEPELYRCAISIAGVARLRRQVNDFGSRTSKKIWQKMTPDFAAVSPINAVDKIETPLLLIHGRKDATVLHKQSEMMNKAMRKAGKTVEFVSLPKADHYFSREADRLALLQNMGRFLAIHNPAY
jgi:dienelactone hydrolase